jgi:phage/plasmid-like protein (TIGR03299 family)
MAHNLNYNANAGRHAFASVKQVAWHGLGTVVQNAMNSEECIKQALLDYKVEKGEAFVKYNTPIAYKKGELIPDTFCTYREDTGAVFGIIGKNYEVVQNHEAFEFFDSIVGSKRAIFETAGALGNGETIFITAKLPDHLLVGGKDVIDQYLLLTNGHDGKTSITAKFTPIRVVCNNTLTAALSSGSNLFKIKHSRLTKDKLKEAEKLLAITYKTSKETQEIYNHLTSIKITDEVRDNYFLDLMLTKQELDILARTQFTWANSPDISTNKKNVLMDIFEYNEKGAGQNMDICKGTAYGAFNTITGYLQNVKSYTDNEKKFSKIMLGSDGTLINSALSKALVLI